MWLQSDLEKQRRHQWQFNLEELNKLTSLLQVIKCLNRFFWSSLVFISPKTIPPLIHKSFSEKWDTFKFAAARDLDEGGEISKSTILIVTDIPPPRSYTAFYISSPTISLLSKQNVKFQLQNCILCLWIENQNQPLPPEKKNNRKQKTKNQTTTTTTTTKPEEMQKEVALLWNVPGNAQNNRHCWDPRRKPMFLNNY